MKKEIKKYMKNKEFFSPVTANSTLAFRFENGYI